MKSFKKFKVGDCIISYLCAGTFKEIEYKQKHGELWCVDCTGKILSFENNVVVNVLWDSQYLLNRRERMKNFL